MYSRWGLILGGILDILFGIVLFVYPLITLNFIFLLFGIYAVFQGIAIVFAAIASEDSSSFRWWLAVGGAIGFFVGLIALFYRSAVLIILIYFVAFRALFVGISELVSSIRLRKTINNEFLLGLAGVVNIIFSIIILTFPLTSAAAFILILGWYSIIVGTILLVRGIFSSNQKTKFA